MHLHQSFRWSRRKFLWASAGLMGSAALHGCASRTSATRESPTAKALKVGTTPWAGFAGHYVAIAKGFFETESITVEEVFFQDGGAGLTAFLANQLDVYWMTSADVIQSASQDPSIRIIKLADYSDGADGILGRGITQPQQIQGKRVARENLLFTNIILQSYLEKAGLSLQDVTLIDTPASVAGPAFAAKQVDAAVTYEPYLSQAVKSGDGSIIFSTKDTNLIADVISTREATIQQKRESLLAYLRAVDRGVKLINASDAEAFEIVGKKLGVSGEEAKQQIAGLKLFDLSGDKATGFDLSNPNNLIENLDYTAKVALDLKMISQPVNVQKLYDDSLVKAL